jgi:hypothetical protein
MAIPPRVFDRPLIARHLGRRPDAVDDFVTRLVLDDLGERLGMVSRRFAQALVMGPDPTVLPAGGVSGGGEFAFERVSTLLNAPGVLTVDPEALSLPGCGYDLVVSLLDLQAIDDVPGFLARVRAHLRADGLFMAAALGGDTLAELRRAFVAADIEVSGGAFARVAPFIPLSDAGGLLQRAGFSLPVSDVETHVVRYQNPLALMAEVKALGGANPLAERPGRMATGRLVAAAAAAYAAEATDSDGRIRATLEIIWMSGWAPDPSQQQPARRGSATVSLTDVLGRR